MLDAERVFELVQKMEKVGDSELVDAVREFQAAVWESAQIFGATSAHEDMIRTLAYDLDLSEFDLAPRVAGPTRGEVQVRKEIHMAPSALRRTRREPSQE